jgi:hypothetical protein
MRWSQARAAAIQAALLAPQLDAPLLVAQAYGQVVGATVAVLLALNAQLAALEEELGRALARHRQAGVLLSQPGLGMVLAARRWASSATTQCATPPPRAARRTPAPRR